MSKRLKVRRERRKSNQLLKHGIVRVPSGKVGHHGHESFRGLVKQFRGK